MKAPAVLQLFTSASFTRSIILLSPVASPSATVAPPSGDSGASFHTYTSDAPRCVGPATLTDSGEEGPRFPESPPPGRLYQMGALYEDVEKFFGDIFAFYGRFLARYPVVFILLSLITSSLLGMGLLNLRYETHVDKLYTPVSSPAFKDQAHLAGLFPERTSKAFYEHQQLFLDTYGSVLVVSKEEEAADEDNGQNEGMEDDKEGNDEGNVLTLEIMTDIKRLYGNILGITLEHGDQGFTYQDLCAAREGSCVVEGGVLLQHLAYNTCLNINTSYPYLQAPPTTLPTTSSNGKVIASPVVGTTGTGSAYSSMGGSGRREDIRSVLSGIDVGPDGCMTAKAFRLRFNLRHDTSHQRNLGLLWEMKFLREVAQFDSTHAHLTYSASESLDIELTEHVGEDTKFFALTIIIMIMYATFVSSGGNWVTTRALLAQAGVVAALLAILASFGLLSMCGMTFVDICGVMPFLVLGVGVDDMFILMSGWRQTDVKKDIEERISETFRSSAISVTITSLTDLLAFCIGATSPFLSVKNFCIYTGVAVFLCYINQLTFFGGCLVLHAQRVASSRHCITCARTSSRRQLEQDGHSRAYVTCCGGHPPEAPGEGDSACEKFPGSFLPRLLLKTPTKTLIIVAFAVYISVSAWGATHIKAGLKLESVVPESSYLHEFHERDRHFFPHRGAYIMFVVDRPVRYSDPAVRDEFRRVLRTAAETGFLDTSFRSSWLESYLEYRRNLSLRIPTATGGNADDSRGDFLRVLKDDFLSRHREFQNDIVFSDDDMEIVASRAYVQSLRFQDSTNEGDLMIRMREIAANSSLPLIAYGPEFIYYEHYVSILKNTLLAVGVATIGMLFVALMFIPHPISITCVTLTMVTIVLGMFGFMHFWGLALSAITTVQIILSVGFCVDFTVHISHAFMTATGKNRNERVMAAVEKVGVPILNGAVSSILGILMLAFTSSYIFKSFFKTMLLVIVLGVAHSLLFLPVMLSFVGPRRTSKPRVFIPINVPTSTSARVFDDMMSDFSRTNSDHQRSTQRAAASQAQQQQQKQKQMLQIQQQHMSQQHFDPNDGREHIEMLTLDVSRDHSAPELLQMTDIELAVTDDHQPPDQGADHGADGGQLHTSSASTTAAAADAADDDEDDRFHRQLALRGAAVSEDDKLNRRLELHGRGGGSTGNNSKASREVAESPQPRASTLPRAHRVLIERPPEEEIRLAQFIPRADRTPSPLLSKPQVDHRRGATGSEKKSASMELLERLGGALRRDGDKRGKAADRRRRRKKKEAEGRKKKDGDDTKSDEDHTTVTKS